jgi:hypothetical protein
LTRFVGHLFTGEGGAINAEESPTLGAGIPATDG